MNLPKFLSHSFPFQGTRWDIWYKEPDYFETVQMQLLLVKMHFFKQGGYSSLSSNCQKKYIHDLLKHTSSSIHHLSWSSMQANHGNHQNEYNWCSEDEKTCCLIPCNKKNALLMFMEIYNLHNCPKVKPLAPYSNVKSFLNPE